MSLWQSTNSAIEEGRHWLETARSTLILISVISGGKTEWTVLFPPILYTEKYVFWEHRKEKRVVNNEIIYILSKRKGIKK